MGKKIVINPFTRISGFLQIEVEVEEKRVVDAKSSGLIFRGFEKMLKGRPPLDAIYFSERICGICSTAHSMGSTLALEDALGIEITENDKMLRDLIHGCEFVQNHLRHFYQYTMPDYVKGPDIPPLNTDYHDDFRLPDRLNRLLAEHYILSTRYSRMAHQALAVLGGKAPHNHGIFVGGVTVNIDASKWIALKSMVNDLRGFAEDIMVHDVDVLARYYEDCFYTGRGYGNFMSYGCCYGYKEDQLIYVDPGVWINGAISQFDPEKITENIRYAWYRADEVESRPGGEATEEDLTKEGAYTWIKAPRYNGLPMEVGPLARMWITGIYRRGISTMDRTIARVLEVTKILKIMSGLLERIELKPAFQRQYEIPEKATGVGLIDTTRGALGHWLSINEEKLLHYDIITPTAWNLSPKDSKGYRGVVEEALIGTEIKDLKHPVEIGRIVRSFDPCVSCATHITGHGITPMEVRII